MKQHLFVLLVATALLSGCGNGKISPNPPDSERTSVPATSLAETEVDPGWLSGEPTQTAETLLARAKGIPHHPLNPATQLPNAPDAKFAEGLWNRYADREIEAKDVLHSAFKEFDGLKRPISCQDLSGLTSLNYGQMNDRWHQEAVQWLRQEHESGKITDEEFELYEDSLIMSPTEVKPGWKSEPDDPV